MMSLHFARAVFLSILLPLAACTTIGPAPNYSEIVRSSDRIEADRALDSAASPTCCSRSMACGPACGCWT